MPKMYFNSLEIAVAVQDLRTDATYCRGEWPFAPTDGGLMVILRKS